METAASHIHQSQHTGAKPDCSFLEGEALLLGVCAVHPHAVGFKNIKINLIRCCPQLRWEVGVNRWIKDLHVLRDLPHIECQIAGVVGKGEFVISNLVFSHCH